MISKKTSCLSRWAHPALLFFICLATACAANRLKSLRVFEKYQSERTAAAMVILFLAAFLGIRSYLVLRQSGTTAEPLQPALVLVETGPYGLSRNPMYLALVAVFAALTLMIATVWMIAALAVLFILMQMLVIKTEETHLESQFGQFYRDYRARVRRWF